MSGLQTCRDMHRLIVDVYTHLSKKKLGKVEKVSVKEGFLGDSWSGELGRITQN